MSQPNPDCVIRNGPKVLRTLLIINFVMSIVLLGPGRSHEFDLQLRRIGIEGLLVYSLQILIVGSTLLATATFGAVLWEKRKIPPEAPNVRIEFDGALLTIWWVIVIGFLAYAFILGTGG